MRRTLLYGGGLTLSRFFNILALKGDYFVVGKVLGTYSLGIYEKTCPSYVFAWEFIWEI